MPCCIWWIDRSHNFLGCNIETCAAFRAYSPEEIQGKTILEIANDKDLSEFKAKITHDSDERVMKSDIVEYQIKSMVSHHITEFPGAYSLIWMNRKYTYLGGNREYCNIVGVDSQN